MLRGWVQPLVANANHCGHEQGLVVGVGQGANRARPHPTPHVQRRRRSALHRQSRERARRGGLR